MTIHLNDHNFEEEVLKSDRPVLVDMYSDWCPPCKVIAPFIEKLSNDYGDKIKVGKLNVDEARQTAMTYGIEVIPTLFIFKQGQIVDKIIGAVPYEFLAQKVEQYL